MFETIEMLSFLRQTVLGPLALVKNGHLPRGVRYIERDALEEMPLLLKIIPAHNKKSCVLALEQAIELYRHLRVILGSSGLSTRKAAEELAVGYLAEIDRKI